MTLPAIEEEWPDFVSVKELATELAFELDLEKKLFQFDRHRVDLLNHRTGQFFFSISRVMTFGIVRAIAALTDPPRTGTNANLSGHTVILQANVWASQEAIVRAAAC